MDLPDFTMILHDFTMCFIMVQSFLQLRVLGQSDWFEPLQVCSTKGACARWTKSWCFATCSWRCTKNIYVTCSFLNGKMMIHQSNQSSNRKTMRINQLIGSFNGKHKVINQSINQSISQSINQSIGSFVLDKSVNNKLYTWQLKWEKKWWSNN